jgi:cell division protease FtsH
MTDALMTYETIDKDQIDDIMAGIKPRPPKGWDDKNDDDDKSSSNSSDIKESGFSDPASNH